MTGRQILAGDRGAVQYDELLGVAVGFDEDSKLVVVFAGVDLLGPAQRRQLADELEGVAIAIRRGQAAPTQ